MASRLSEVDSATVLLLEAGKSAPPESSVPFLVTLTVDGETNWGIKGKPQTQTHFGYPNNVYTLNQFTLVEIIRITTFII